MFTPESILLLKKYILKNDKVLFKDNEEINDDFILEDGIKLYTKSEEEEKKKKKKVEELKIQENNNNGESFVVIVNKEEIL